MHTVDLLHAALCALRQLGYGIRYADLDGAAGVCRIQKRDWLFLDYAQSPFEQLQSALHALRQTPRATVPLPLELSELLEAGSHRYAA